MKHLIKKLEFKSCIRVTILTVLMSSFMINPAHAQRVKLSLYRIRIVSLSLGLMSWWKELKPVL